MKIRYSVHARRKMAERNIPKERVETVLRAGTRLLVVKNRQRAVTIVDNIETTVIFVEDNSEVTIITVWDELSPRR